MDVASLADLIGVLGGIERREAKLLSWGFVDGGYSRDELLHEVDSVRHELGVEEEPEEIVTALESLGAIVRMRYPGRDLYRSRMAETVRLMARSRQLFEQHLHGDQWRTAPNLVADYRLQLQPRRYPKRDLGLPHLDGLLAEDGASAFERSAMRYMVGDRSLAGFQIRSTRSILTGLRSTKNTGVIVTAGTGSGKTLSFYLPVLADIGNRVGPSRWVKSVAIYPRNELLKDQFVETYRQARSLDQLLEDTGRRKLAIGAFFGDTPRSARNVTDWGKWGNKRGDGWICPYMRCPVCGEDVIWREEDAREGTERLVCTASGCRGVVSSDEVILTRDRMATGPPDLLFTTTEMLNQRFTDTRYRHLFGIGPRAIHKPNSVLLDEVHTYMGTHGAQVGLLMRRWAHAIGRPIVFVGLSATLRDPESFFADLTGVVVSRIRAVAPSEAELESEGMEYLVALRGDPTSGVSLLSTTIQTAFLLPRTLDTATKESEGLFGQRVFLFTDDLDVTNRLYFDILNAEAYDPFGRPHNDPRRPHGALANLRASVLQDRERRLIDGQSWDMSERLGHRFDATSRLSVGRTSSQDVGVDSDSQLIVATAALEVGFNDPTVGAVIQHKSPRSAAQFLQRRGRAGRIRHMRPWTVVVLSDYGRDRLIYQAYDQLFDPELRPRRLPVRNRYVLRMQAVYSTLDWLGAQVERPQGSIWEDLSGPPSEQTGATRQEQIHERQNRVLQHVEEVLRDPKRREELADHLAEALAIDYEEVRSILWEPPRSLLLEVLPTIRRRLITNWHNPYPLPSGSDEFHLPNAPLPEFIPRALFADLALPEVTISTPAQTRHLDDEEQNLPIAQAIKEFAPGRVTRRYAMRHGYVRHWVPIDTAEDSGSQEVDCRVVAPHLSHVTEMELDGQRIRVLRPWSIRAEKPPPEVADSTNAFPEWRSAIQPRSGNGDRVDPPTPSKWDRLIEGIEFFTHSRNGPVDVLRMAIGSTASVNFKRGGNREYRIRFIDQGEPVGLGYSLGVDAFRMFVRTPDFTQISIGQAHLRGMRVSRFHHLVENDLDLRRIAGPFKPAWLARLYLFALVTEATESGSTLQEAGRTVGGTVATTLRSVIETYFGTLEPDGEDSDLDTSIGQSPGRLRSALEELIQIPEVSSILQDHATVLWGAPEVGWYGWLAETLASTIGAAVVQACERLMPNVNSSDLVVDLVTTPNDSSHVEVWISETTLGGAGIVEEFRAKYAENPRRFFNLVEASLGPSDFELVDSELRRVLSLLDGDNDIARLVDQVRVSVNPNTVHTHLRRLLDELRDAGVFICHPVVAAISTRLLRPGTNRHTDRLLRSIVAEWSQEEERLGVEIDGRTVAYAFGARSSLDGELADAGLPVMNDDRWRIGALYGLVWPRGWEVRGQSLSVYNPFSPLPMTDRLLASSVLGQRDARVNTDLPDWLEAVADELRTSGVAVIFTSSGDKIQLQHALATLVSSPIEVGFMHLYPRLAGVTRDGGLGLRLEIAEAPQ